jgi:hypothetical protein
MTAKKMFEKLGYKYEKRENEILYYTCTKEKMYEYILFFLDIKEFIKDNEDGVIGQYSLEINMKELKAINKQVEELGW